MSTKTLDKVMLALEEASQSVPTKQEGWATLEQVKAFEKTTTVIKLTDLVKEGRAERRKKNGKLYWRPVRGGGGGSGILDLPKEGYRSPDPYDTPRGKEPGGTRPDGEWNNWGKPNESNPTGVIAAAGMGAGAGAGGAAASAATGTVRGTIANIM